MNAPREIRIRVPALARVEGEGALDIEIQDGRIAQLQLRIFEPPRLFEKFLEGRAYHEVPDMVARICGICPVAYQMSAVQAIERIFGVEPDEWVMAARRILYCGEWIQSHSLHIHLLAAPDFLGFDNAIAMAEKHGDALRRGLELQALGNAIIALFGARSVHPVGVRVGGFYRAPTQAEVDALGARLEAAVPAAAAVLRWTGGFPLPDQAEDLLSVALVDAHEYPMNRGRIVASDGLAISCTDFETHFKEVQMPHSTALHALYAGRPYLVGPLARMNLNHDTLPTEVQRAIASTGVVFPSGNMYHSIVARAAELYFAVVEAGRLLRAYRVPERAYTPVRPVAGEGAGCTEAPRGLLWHRYQLDGDGHVRAARIVPPTSQNQARIEQNLRFALESGGLARSADAMRRQCETVVRNYDPCISCATHFLQVTVDRK